MENNKNNREAFGIYGNQYDEKDGKSVSIYGNNRNGVKSSSIANLISKSDNLILNNIATIFKPKLINILNQYSEYSMKVYKETGYDKEITFDEFFIWWYHFIYTKATDIMNEKQMLELSSKVLHLSQCFEKSIPSNSQRVLDELSLITQASAALVIAEGADCVVIKSSQTYNPILQIKYQIGSRHPIGLAATGKVIAATYPSHVDETEEIQRVSQQGYAYSKDALQVGTAGLFMPLPHRHMAVGIVKLGDIELETSLIALKKAVLQLQS